MTAVDPFWKAVGVIAAAWLAMMLSRILAIAAARRASYAPVASRIVELWRDGSPRKYEILVELVKPVVGGNKDLYKDIEAFADAINALYGDAGKINVGPVR